MRHGLMVLVVLLVGAAVVPPSAAAQPASTAEIGTQLKSGDTVYVLNTASREIEGVFGMLSGSTMTLMVNGELRDIAWSDVRQITRRGGDPLWNGILIGAGVGALAGGLQGGRIAVAGAVFYGAIGALIDGAVRGRVVVYRAPAAKSSVTMGPFLAQGRRGVLVSVSF